MEKTPDNLSHWLVVVPARLASTRLPNKPLQDLGGKPLIVRVFENIKPLTLHGAKVIVATDAESVAQACRAQQIPVEMTAEEHQSGTDRCFEVAKRNPRPYILNVQGDEPCVDCGDLLTLMAALENQTHAALATLVYRSQNAANYRNPNVVKAVRSEAGMALYFSRSPIPYARNSSKVPDFWQHLGIYAFREAALKQFCSLPPSLLEQVEKLEQLRALENGMSIYLQPAKKLTLGIDTLEDLEVARARF